MTVAPKNLETVKAMLLDAMTAALLNGQTARADSYDRSADITRPYPEQGDTFDCISIRDGGFYVSLLDADKLAASVLNWFAAQPTETFDVELETDQGCITVPGLSLTGVGSVQCQDGSWMQVRIQRSNPADPILEQLRAGRDAAIAGNNGKRVSELSAAERKAARKRSKPADPKREGGDQ